MYKVQFETLNPDGTTKQRGRWLLVTPDELIAYYKAFECFGDNFIANVERYYG